MDDILDKRRKRLRLICLILRKICNDAGIKIDFHLVARINSVTRSLTLQNRQTDVNGIAVKNSINIGLPMLMELR